MPMPPYTLTANSKLTEDYVHSDAILGDSSATMPMAVFTNAAGNSEALLIAQSGELCHLQREPLSSSGWNIYGIGATLETIAAANSGTVWALSSDQTVWYSNAGHWNTIGAINAGGLNLSVGQDDTVYAVGEESDGFHLFVFDALTGQFQDNGATPIARAPVGTSGSLWAVSSNQVMMNGPSAWTLAAPLPNGDTPAQVDTGNDGSVFVRGQSGAIYSYDQSSQTWTALAGTPAGVISMAVANAQTIYAQVAETVQSCINGAWLSLPATPYELQNISVGNDGTLWALSYYGTVWQYGDSAWMRQMMPTNLSGATGGHKITEVVTGRHSDGNQYAFYVQDGCLYYSMLDMTKAFGGYWTEGQMLLQQPCSNFSATVSSIDALVVHGTTESGLFVTVQNANGSWTATTTQLPYGSVANTTIQFTQPGYGGWIAFLVKDQRLGCLQLVGLGSSNWADRHLEAQLPSLQTVVPFPLTTHGTAAHLYTCALDTQGQLWFVLGDDPQKPAITQLSGSAVSSPIGAIASAVIINSGSNSARIFARDENNLLWILRVDISGANFTWSQWHPLGNNCIFLANGPASATSADLFMLDSGAEVNVLSEDIQNSVWNELIMLQPAGTNTDAQYVSRYLNELTVTDQNGSPVPNLQLDVTADEPIGVWVGTTLYNVGTTEPAQLTTNSMGQVTFGFYADDLHTPTFNFTADGLTDAPALYPAQAVSDYLSGSTTALPGRPVFDPTGSTLSAATMQIAPDWEPNATTTFVQGSTAQGNAAAAAKAITQVYTIPLSSTGSSGQWSPAASSGDLEASAFWHDLCSYAHDIDHAIRKAALKVSYAVVDIENKIVSITMELANGLSQMLTLVINTAKDVVSAVKSAFRFIERGVDEAIHWLKSLFSWGDIINTKRVIEAGLTGMMDRFATNLDPKSPYYVGTLFDSLWQDDVVDKITSGFTTLMDRFASPASFSTTTAPSTTPLPPQAAPMGPDALHPSDVSGAQSSNGTHTNYVHGHVANYTNSGGRLPSQAGGDGTSGDSVMAGLFTAIENSLMNNKNFTPMETCTSLQNIFSNPKAFADVAIYDVLNALQDAVVEILDVIQDIFNELFNLAQNAFNGFQKVLTTVLDIPIISWIYQKIAQAPLTLLDLLCLVMAVPATIVYKLTFGLASGQPPFTAGDVTALQQQYANGNFPWPAAAGGSTGLSAATTSLGSFPFPGAGILMVLNGATYGIFDCLNDLTAHTATVQQLTDPDFEDPISTFFSWASITTTFVGQWLTAPYDIFPGRATTAENLTLGLWSLNFIPFVSGLVFTVVSKDHALSEFNSAYGVYLNTAIGLLLLGVGIATTVEQIEDSKHKYNPCYWVQNLLAPLPTILKPLITITDEPAGSIATGGLILCDAAMDTANFSLAFVEDAV